MGTPNFDSAAVESVSEPKPWFRHTLDSMRASLLVALCLMWHNTCAQDAPTDWLLGTWYPDSRGWQGHGPLKITKTTVTWNRCGPAPYSIVRDIEQDTYPSSPGAAHEYPRMHWRVITIQVSSTKWNCEHLSRYRYFQFGFRPPLKGWADVAFYESPERFAAQYFSQSRFISPEGQKANPNGGRHDPNSSAAPTPK